MSKGELTLSFRREIERIRTERNAFALESEERRAEIERLQAKLVEAQKDAARYRWYRSPVNAKNIDHSFLNSAKGGYELKTGKELDVAIDAAIAAQARSKP